MGTLLDRAGIPAEFQDLTTERMLRPPRPQFFHGTLIKGAIAAQTVKMAESMGLPLPGRSDFKMGANIPADVFGSLVLNDPSGLFGAVRYYDEFDRMGGMTNPGHAIRINRPVYPSSTYTYSSRQIPSGTTISTTGQAIQMEQVEHVLTRIGGPYASSAVTPYVLERFDLERSIHNAAQMVGEYMQFDIDSVFDSIGVTLFDACASTGIVRPDGMTDNNTPTATTGGSFPFTYDLLAKLKTTMVSSPSYTRPLANGNYALLLHPRQVQQLKTDSAYQRLAQFHKEGINPLFMGSYQFTIDGFDVYQSSTLTTASNTSSVTIYYGQAFGEQTIGVSCPRKPEIVPSAQDNYGESIPLVWLANFAATLLDNRYVFRVTTD
jgi:hypothetical protein